MTISIIIPIYNTATYLATCLDIVLRQTYSDLQIILVDDGSTDESVSICDDYAQNDSRVQVVHKDNGGLSDARNVGTALATGEYLLYIDSDDRWDSLYFVEHLVTQAKKTQADIVLCGINRFIKDDKLPANALFSYEAEDFTGTSLEIFECLYKKQHFLVSACCKLVKTSVLRTNKIVFEKALLGEDMDWTSRLMPHIRSISFSNEAVYLYRDRPNSITTTFGKKNADDFCYILERWQQYWLQSDNVKQASIFLGYYANLYVTLVYHYYFIPSVARSVLLPRIASLASLLSYANTDKALRVKRLRDCLGVRWMIYLSSWVYFARQQVRNKKR